MLAQRLHVCTAKVESLSRGDLSYLMERVKTACSTAACGLLKD